MDLISRQAAIDALGEKPLNWTDDEYELGLQNQWKYDVDAIKALPPVTPKPKTDVLDKIRAEMFVEMLSHSGTGEEAIQAYADGLRKGLDILDKYKAESGDKE